MPQELLVPHQSPEIITDKVHSAIQRTSPDIPREVVQREISDLWDSIRNPALRQFVAPLAENVLLKKHPPKAKILLLKDYADALKFVILKRMKIMNRADHNTVWSYFKLSLNLFDRFWPEWLI
ncbi:hypothetical protein BH09PAT1_BH09PAT1_8310 [soil metagenome]